MVPPYVPASAPNGACVKIGKERERGEERREGERERGRKRGETERERERNTKRQRQICSHQYYY
jgi:hypothetical protein